MLQLKDITKTYGEGEAAVQALKGVSLAFRKSEFVSILGPSGCGKTTMLNILGGLDRYNSGDLLIDGKSTQFFKSFEWDAYRNNCVGFIFQSYNLISHQTILENVELALTLSGVSMQERKKRATAALEEVGLGSILKKKPNQLSGGQMQRVAIARAIVNDPEIILADEPTGALDSVNSVQIIELLQEVSKNRLVVMVTHNEKIAEKYSNRIINMLDGEIISDTSEYNPTEEDLATGNMIYVPEPAPITENMDEKSVKKILDKHNREQLKKKKAIVNKTSMSVATSFRLSINNLFTKKGRTFMTAFAGSIGIIGIALVMSISNGFNIYISDMQTDMLGQSPISVMQEHLDMKSMMVPPTFTADDTEKFPDDEEITVPNAEDSGLNAMINQLVHFNRITPDYVEYIEKMPEEYYSEIMYQYGLSMNLLAEDNDGTYKHVMTAQGSGMDTSNLFYELASEEFMKSQYDVIHGKYPVNKNEIVLLVNERNQISEKFLRAFGLEDKDNFTFDEIIGQEFSLIGNDKWYGPKIDNKYSRNTDYNADMYNSGTKVEVVGIMRISPDAAVKIYQEGMLYHPDLTDYIIEDSINSIIGEDQANELVIDLTTGKKLMSNAFVLPGFQMDLSGILGVTQDDKHFIAMQKLGATSIPKNIVFYPTSFDGKDELLMYLNQYNFASTSLEEKHIIFNDPASMMTDSMGQMVDIISIVLVSFAAVSLLVSSIMIGIITYVSVVERTKEIGILRSIGARKKDIGRVFNSETAIIGLSAGTLGVIISYILTIPINIIIKAVSDGIIITNFAVLNPLVALVLVLISVTLTLIAGIIPSSIAAKKDPVTALRSD